MYDYLVVGAGMFGSVFAHRASQAGKKVLVIDRRDHIGGNCHTKMRADIDIHWYGAHIFHTSDEEIWRYITQFGPFNSFRNAPIARYKDELYNLPFNMNTFHAMWGIKTPAEAAAIIEAQRKASGITEPHNLEEQAIMLVGQDIYDKLIKGYTEKQWGRPCSQLPAFIIQRLPVRFRYDNNYFNDRYQGIPEEGYTALFSRMLTRCDVELNTDFFNNRVALSRRAHKIVYTGMQDQYFDYCFGHLEYRSLRFEHQELNEQNHQGVAVVNYTEAAVPYTRIIEHKHFTYGEQATTILSYEYPEAWEPGKEPYYPVNDTTNNDLAERYHQLAIQESRVIFGGRLADYRYYDMHQVIAKALEAANKELT